MPMVERLNVNTLTNKGVSSSEDSGSSPALPLFGPRLES
jgi:hypothetical protein